MAKHGANSYIGAAIAVASTGVAYSKSQVVGKGQQFGLWVQLSSAGTPNVKFEVEQSYDLPTTEEASDSKYVVPDGIASISTINDKNAHIFGVPLRPMIYFRLKMTGISANPSDTTAKVILFVQQSGD